MFDFVYAVTFYRMNDCGISKWFCVIFILGVLFSNVESLLLVRGDSSYIYFGYAVNVAAIISLIILIFLLFKKSVV